MNQWDAPLLVVVAAAPGAALLAFTAAVFFWQRKIGAVSAVTLSLGVALTAELLFSLAVHTTHALYHLRDSLSALLGFPLFVYALTLLWLARRWRINAALVILVGTPGVICLYYLSGVVLMSSVCGINLGGC